MKRHVLLAGIAAMMLTACNQKTETTLTLSGLDPVKFQTTVNDAQTQLYTLKNKAGMEVCITNFGGRIVSIMVPDKNGVMQDVVLGFDSIAVTLPGKFSSPSGEMRVSFRVVLSMGLALYTWYCHPLGPPCRQCPKLFCGNCMVSPSRTIFPWLIRLA